MAKAKTFSRGPVDREIKTAKQGSARDAIGTLTPGCETYILTYGQFSLIDALMAILEQTGPADVDMATWSASSADLTTASRLMEQATIRKMRLMVDRSFLLIKPEWCQTMRRLFGDECIRTTRTHAKCMAIRNEKWHIAVRTSMNLNTNPRMENLELSDDPRLCGFLTGVFDNIFRDVQPGLFAGELPSLDGVPNTQAVGGVVVGKVNPSRRASTGPSRRT